MSVAHVLRPMPEGGACQLFLLLPDAGCPWQSVQVLGDALSGAFPAAAVVVLQGPHGVREGGCWLMKAAPADTVPPGQHASGVKESAGGADGRRRPEGRDKEAAEREGKVAMAADQDRRTEPLALPTADDAALADAVETALPGLLGSVRVWQEQMKVLPEATALIGVGEGATMALAAALAGGWDGAPVCGRASLLGGRFVVPDTEPPSALLLHLLHGKANPMVDYRHTVKAAESLVKLGADVVADIVPHETEALSNELMDWLMNRLLNRVPRHVWQAAMRTTDDAASNQCPSERGH